MTDIGAPDVSGTAPVGEAVTGSGPESGSGGNPAWKPFLDVLPTSLHSAVTPVLQDWDKTYQGTQRELSEVQSQYSPYADIVNGVDPDMLRAAMQIAQQIESDPRGFYDSMGDYYKDDWGQGQQGQEDQGLEFDPNEGQYDVTQDPMFQELQQNQQTMADYLAGNIQQQQEDAADAEVETEWKAAQQKHGNALDENFVMSLALSNGVSIEQAADSYMNHVAQVRQQPRAGDGAPRVISPNGGIPSTQIDPAKMDNKQTRNLVAQILAQAHQES